MKIWIDDVRPAPDGYIWCKSVNEARKTIRFIDEAYIEGFGVISSVDEPEVELIDIDHDAGDYAPDGGDYIKLLDWLEETGRNYPIRIHSMNPVGVVNMRAIIEKNGWREVR
jgi:hypothetical protein